MSEKEIHYCNLLNAVQAFVIFMIGIVVSGVITVTVIHHKVDSIIKANELAYQELQAMKQTYELKACEQRK